MPVKIIKARRAFIFFGPIKKIEATTLSGTPVEVCKSTVTNTWFIDDIEIGYRFQKIIRSDTELVRVNSSPQLVNVFHHNKFIGTLVNSTFTKV